MEGEREDASAPAAESGARAPARPCLGLALALALGSAWGAHGGISRGACTWLAACLAAGWIGWSAKSRDSPPARATSGRTGSVGVAGLALCTLLGALRAAAEPAVPWTREVAAWEGVWHPRWESEAEVRGRLALVAPRTPEFELPRGCALAGERIRILRGDPPVPSPRGPGRGAARESAGAARPQALTPPEAPESPAEPEAHELVVARADEVLRLAARESGPGWIASWRAHLDRRAAAAPDPAAASLARAFLLGDSSALEPETADLFTRNGLRHVLAVSGWHVAMMAWWIVRPIAGLAGLVAERWPRHRKLQALLTVLASAALCLAYVPLTGGGAPVRRSAIAVAIAATVVCWPRARDERPPGWSATRRIDALSLWSVALAVECWLDPAAVTEVAVQLSYAATLGLILWTRPLAAALARACGADVAPEPRELLSGWLRQCLAAGARRCLRAAATGVGASLAAVAATAPIVWLTFGEACPWGVLSTPLLAPLFVALFVGGTLMLAVPVEPAAEVFGALSRMTIASLEAIDRLPGTPALLPVRPAWLIAATLGAAWLAAAVGAGGPAIAALLRAAAAAGGALLALPWTPAPSGLELWVLDVGHGTAVAFRAPGEPCWIFDCGSRDRSRVAQVALAPLLRHWDVVGSKVALSHADKDHASGLRWVVERARPRAWVGALPAPLAERLPHTCPRLDLSEGRLEVPESAPELDLLLVRGLPEDGNEGSRSLLLRASGQVIVLCGDAVGDGWALPLRAGLGRWRAGTLLAPHHGSQGERLGPLLDALQPARIWVSCSSPPAMAAEFDRRRIPWDATCARGPILWRPP